MGEAELWRMGLCVGACTEVGNICEWGAFMWGENYGWFFARGGDFCPECLPQMSVFEGTLISVIMQNLNEIGQSAAEL